MPNSSRQIRRQERGTTWAFQGGMHLFRKAEREICAERPERGIDVKMARRKKWEAKMQRRALARKSKSLMRSLPLFSPARAAQRRRVGHMQPRAAHCHPHGKRVKSPVKAFVSTERTRRRRSWFLKKMNHFAPAWFKKRTLEDRWVFVDWRPPIDWSLPSRWQSPRDPSRDYREFRFADGCTSWGDVEFWSSQVPEPEGISAAYMEDAVVESTEFLDRKRTERRILSLFRRWRRGAFMVLYPDWSRGCPPRGNQEEGTLSRILKKVRRIPNRAERRSTWDFKTREEVFRSRRGEPRVWEETRPGGGASGFRGAETGALRPGDPTPISRGLLLPAEPWESLTVNFPPGYTLADAQREYLMYPSTWSEHSWE